MTTTPAIQITGLTTNGAGKTTAVEILTTLLRPDGGTATVNGYDVATQAAEAPAADEAARLRLVAAH